MAIPILAAVGIAQQLFSLLKPRGSASAPASQTTSATQAVQGQYPHQKSMADVIGHLRSAIDYAVKTGKLSGDQATQMKRKLDFITQTLNKTQTSAGAPLTPDDLQQIRTNFQEVRRQLFDVLYPRGTASLASGGTGYNLFKTMGANGNGMIDKNQLSNFISTLL